MPELKKSVSQKLRMADRDYTRGGWYFVTLNADYHRHLFGEVVGGRTPAMACNELGRMVERKWAKIPDYFTGVRLGAAQVMIWLVPMAMPKTVPTKWAGALATGRALWLSAFPDEMTEASRETCQLCNTWAERLERGTTP